jgi:hypothetical protein
MDDNDLPEYARSEDAGARCESIVQDERTPRIVPRGAVEDL